MSSRTGKPPPTLEVRGDPTFESFYHREFPAIRAVAWTLTGNVWTAEEIAQDAFLRAHRNWDRIADYDEPGAWVRRVAINLATSRLRRAGREVRALARLSGRRTDDWYMPEPSREFWAAVRALPRQQAAVLTLHYYEDLPIADIATVLGVAEGTVKAHLYKGRDALRRWIERTGGVPR
ncbi:MAG TPA: SigE family RNA polymerase sigma factor [Micromonosporaceae bacterium]|nr:SigE family RNA polymerase sigma factor [Micromonosporaceae bacterium]